VGMGNGVCFYLDENFLRSFIFYGNQNTIFSKTMKKKETEKCTAQENPRFKEDSFQGTIITCKYSVVISPCRTELTSS
jgi:hypothetical protein